MINLILLGLLLTGGGLTVGGVFVLFGSGWAMIAGAGCCFGLAVSISKGLNG